jgi:hypothetical protein
LAEWKAYEQEYGPFGPERGDWNAAVVAHTVASALSGKGRRWKITDFLTSWAPKRRQSPQEQLAAMQALTKRTGNGNDR